MLSVTQQQIQARDGTWLHSYILGPARGPIVLCVPGLFSNHTVWLGTRGIGFARAAAAAGYRVVVPDPRGHGKSERLLGWHRWRFEQWWKDDLPAVLEAALTGSDREDAQIVAHSAGGAAALACLATQPRCVPHVRSLCLVGTPAPPDGLTRRAVAWSAARLARFLGGFPARSLGLGPEDEPPEVMQQWMSWNWSQGWHDDLGDDVLQRCRSLQVPCLSLAGAGDTLWAPPDGCWSLLQRSGSPVKRFHCCGVASGYSADFTHSGLLTSAAARREVWPLILSWLHEHQGPAPT